VLVTTHYLDEAERCHRVALIHAGKLAAIGSPAEVKDTFAGRAIVEVRAADPVALMRALDSFPSVEKTSLFGTAVHAVLREGQPDGEALAAELAKANVQVTGLTRVPPSLEDVFLDVVDKAGQAR
jgi:ABC-2 type transport system ATP-binding protein